MAIKRTYNERAFSKELEKAKTDVVDSATNSFFKIGKRAVDIAISDGNYINRTGVLRSSIGCGVSYNGVLVKEYGFFQVAAEGAEGSRKGREFLHSILSENVKFNELKLVVVAGANYATFVEDRTNFRVVSKGFSFMDENINFILRSLKVIDNE